MAGASFGSRTYKNKLCEVKPFLNGKPTLFFKTVSAQRSLGGAPGTESLPMASLLTPWSPAGGLSTSGPSQGQVTRGPSREQSASGPSWGFVLVNSRGNSRPRWEDGSLRRHHLPFESHGRRPRRQSWYVPLLPVHPSVGLSQWPVCGKASLRATASCIDIGSGAMRQRQSECST